ncbi:MAG: N-acetyl-gamma-glutamyl-phosphate reductase [Gammaproteobacteria bacterium]|nr:N-acetyl-gamma-glutamyl-phosphate reductase [Gammaproteobacteria bacterium]
MISVGIVGGTGYAGVELMRLLIPRDDVELTVVTSRELQGAPIGEYFPNLRNHTDLNFSSLDEAQLMSCDVVFYATPHAVAMKTAPALLEANIKVIDLSADFRIKDIAAWEKWYKTEHFCPELIKLAVYGLPEVNREKIKSANLIAVPGCYPTAIQLGLIPLLENDLVDSTRLIADAKSGVSGAGRKAVEDYLLAEASESIKAYGVNGHRHHPEICQELNKACVSAVSLTFIPHLVPMVRGILATLYAPGKNGNKLGQEQLQLIFEDRYSSEPFVEVLPDGQSPATRNVKGSNRCEISVTYSQETDIVVVMVAEDNLVKGAAGQAIQNMNLMFGLEETVGLRGIALLP